MFNCMLQALYVYQQAAKLPSAGQVASGKAALLTRQLQRQRQQASKQSQPGGSSFGFDDDKTSSQQPKRKQGGSSGSSNSKAQAIGQIKHTADAAGGRLASAPVVGTIADDAAYEAARQEMVNCCHAAAAPPGPCFHVPQLSLADTAQELTRPRS